MASGGFSVEISNVQKMSANESTDGTDTNGGNKCGTKTSQILACGFCATPTTESECKYFCVRCDVFICESCLYHRNLTDDDDDDDDDGAHFTEVTVGGYAKTFAEKTKKRMDKEMTSCQTITVAKKDYKNYLESCISKCKTGTETFQKTVDEINTDLVKLHEILMQLQNDFDELKEVYKTHNAVSLIQKRHEWNELAPRLNDIERSHAPRICLTEAGDVGTEYPTVVLDKYCVFDGIQGQDLGSKNIKRAWVLHAGELYVYRGEFDLSEEYYKSQIRPWVTFADNADDNVETLVYLMQISGYVGHWERNDIEMSGQPYFNATNTDSFGTTFILDTEANKVHIHRQSHITEVKLPFSEDISPIILCVDPERELLCVYMNEDYSADRVFVYKIRYTFQPTLGKELPSGHMVPK